MFQPEWAAEIILGKFGRIEVCISAETRKTITTLTSSPSLPRAPRPLAYRPYLVTGFLNPWILININGVLQCVRCWVFNVRVLCCKSWVLKTAPLLSGRSGRAEGQQKIHFFIFFFFLNLWVLPNTHTWFTTLRRNSRA